MGCSMLEQPCLVGVTAVWIQPKFRSRGREKGEGEWTVGGMKDELVISFHTVPWVGYRQIPKYRVS